MPDKASNNIDFYRFSGFLLIILAITPLYYQPNLGGVGLELTFNITIWAAVTSFICFTAILVVARKVVKFPARVLCFIAVPVVIWLQGMVTEPSQSAAFLFRELYILGGLCFLIALFQFRVSQSQLEWILLMIAFSILSQSIIGGIQILSPEMLGTRYETSPNSIPHGVFQQVNALASYLVTGIAVSFYLFSRPIVNKVNPVILAILVLLIGLATWVVIQSGSRVGLISLIASLGILLVFRRRHLMRNKILVLCALIAIGGGTLQARSGLEKALDKSAAITEGLGGDVRLNMYRIAAELIAQKPVRGHGIGNFLKVWNLQASDYISRHPQAKLPAYLEHPHNELLYWLIEGGLIIVSGILAAIIAVVIALVHCGPTRAAGYIAMLLPITLHSQVEMPFFISSAHWFLLLFLVFLVTRHQTSQLDVQLSQTATYTVKAGSVLVFAITLYFLQHTSRAQADIINFLGNHKIDTPPLQIALSNYYHKKHAQELAMRTLLYKGINTDNPEFVRRYIEWSGKPIAREPKLVFYRDLFDAYSYLEDEDARCEMVKSALKMYAQNKGLQELHQSCNRNLSNGQ